MEFLIILYLMIICPLLAFAWREFLRRRWKFPKALNYKKESIPTGFGLFFAFFNLFMCFAFLFRWAYPLDEPSNFCEIYFPFFVALVGYYDDVKGQKNIKGLRSNLMTFLSNGILTSSLLKAIVIILCAFFVSVLYPPLFSNGIFIREIFVNMLFIALLTNLFNLLDIRPGRAIKVFTVLCVLFLVSFVHFVMMDPLRMLIDISLVAIPVMSAVYAYAPLDFRGEAMMGDAGSNMLGFVLGIGYAVILPFWWKVAVVISLTLFHIYCEFYSFSDFISRNKVLRWLDELGTCMRNDRQ